FEDALLERAVFVEELRDELTFRVPDRPAAFAPALEVLALAAELAVLVPRHPRTTLLPTAAPIPRLAPSLVAVRRKGAEQARTLGASDRSHAGDARKEDERRERAEHLEGRALPRAQNRAKGRLVHARVLPMVFALSACAPQGRGSTPPDA